MKCNCNCHRLAFRVLSQGNVISNRPTRKLLAKCKACPRSYVCYANNMEVRFLNSGIKIERAVNKGYIPTAAEKGAQ
jgi:hypothetical protein